MDRKSDMDNKNCSSCIQAVIDIFKFASMFPDDNNVANLCIQLKAALDSNPAVTREADKEFEGHLYPASSIAYSKVQQTSPHFRVLSAPATQIMDLFIANIRDNNNYMQLSACSIVAYTGIANKKTAGRALQELLEKGFIAVKIPEKGNAGAVYMLNPAVATVGKEKRYMRKAFWELTGSKYDYVQVADTTEQRLECVFKSEQQEFFESVMRPAYSTGEGKQETKEGLVKYSRLDPYRQDIKAERTKETPAGAGNTTAGDEQICNN